MALVDFKSKLPGRSYGRLFAFSWLMGEEKRLFFIFIASSCQDDFLGGGQDWYHHNQNFTVSNVVVEIF